LPLLALWRVHPINNIAQGFGKSADDCTL